MRAFVGPNTIQMKAARYILSQPGITLAKSSILCGGPDWPTSVICGLLGLDCCSMLVGLVPIVVFTTPGTLLGTLTPTLSPTPTLTQPRTPTPTPTLNRHAPYPNPDPNPSPNPEQARSSVPS